MTKAGFGFIAAGGLIYLVASQSQIGWLYLFDAIIWSLLVLSAILPWYSLKSLQVERQVLLLTPALHQPTLAGPLEDETVEVKLKVTNSGRLARHFIRVAEDCPFEQPEQRHRDFITPDDVKVVSPVVLRHRILPRSSEPDSPAKCIEAILSTVPVPL